MDVRKAKPNQKKILWDKFDIEINNKQPSKVLECVYRSSGDRDSCEQCSSSLRITDEGFLSCTNSNCGIIYTDTIDQSAEWRFYKAEDSRGSDPNRCGLPINPLLRESSFSCKVICRNGSSSYEMRKIRRVTEWQGMPYKEKALWDEFQKIDALANMAGIPKLIIDDAKRQHTRILGAQTFRGLNRDGIIAASIYIAARINKFPRTPKEIAKIFILDVTSATKGCKNAVNIINSLEKDLHDNEKTHLCPFTPASFIDRYCSKLNINSELTKVCMFIAIRIHKNNIIPEKTPHAIAGGIICLISQLCNLNITKKSISAISDISEVTINKCYKKLEVLKDKLVPKEIISKYTI